MPPRPLGQGSLPLLSPGIAATIPAPEKLACQLAVNGIMQSQGKPLAIVQVADQPLNQTVQVGDHLCGGLVVVKQISSPGSRQPNVILEQNGKEFIQFADG
ncbi:hypothetical protein DO97_09355 [Neosynechococcus sphagnicola sy1]|uniref:Uncharacterized protein n=1 Tax=Neosynechococcus sphagnicola sy1 TaxID=1497020 RepID=A0A098TJG3_9CYAN|nr:hypothetical protein [Neosynechococcus sphagnicola]KGF72309.1 hypothetical protein DO97_09355 [Neosynechococcus sphagnicola sy1]